MSNDDSPQIQGSLKLIIVDDHPLFSEGLKLTLQQLAPDIDLLCVDNLSSAKRALNNNADIDLILLDLNLPDGKGLSLIRYLKAHQLFIPCVIISASDEPLNIRVSLQAGASGFISKANTGQTILENISHVMNGGICLPGDFQAQEKLASTSQVDGNSLTPRQKDVLTLLAEGHPNKVICQRLNLTEHTVKSHLKALFQALDVHSRTECARVATLLGILD